jgi:hypothetical protein
VILENLVNAIEKGESLRVRYFGGSSPGIERELQPLSIKDGKVRAVCLLSNETKTFLIEKMELAIEGVASEKLATLSAPPQTYPSLDELVANESEPFKEMGWYVQYEGKAVSLHRAFKNGKLIQTPDVSLAFEATTFDLILDGDQLVEANHRERARPWVVSAKNQTAKAFTNFKKAQLEFLQHAKSLSPKQVQKAD